MLVHADAPRMSAGRLLGRGKEYRKGRMFLLPSLSRWSRFSDRTSRAPLSRFFLYELRGDYATSNVHDRRICGTAQICAWSDWTLLACKARCRSRCMKHSRIAKIGYLAPAFYVFTARAQISRVIERTRAVWVMSYGQPECTWYTVDSIPTKDVNSPIKTRRQIYWRDQRDAT